MNERKTEQYVRDMFVKLGYLKDDFIIEEQQSDNPPHLHHVNQALRVKTLGAFFFGNTFW